jgi:hypothetical protein
MLGEPTRVTPYLLQSLFVGEIHHSAFALRGVWYGAALQQHFEHGAYREQ